MCVRLFRTEVWRKSILPAASRAVNHCKAGADVPGIKNKRSPWNVAAISHHAQDCSNGVVQ